MKKLFVTAAMIAIGFTATHSLAAGDAAAGKTRAMACAACHGAAGISPTDIWPNLAGQKAGYLVKQMKDFRDDKRQDPIMGAQAKSLSDQDIENIAAYYSGLK